MVSFKIKRLDFLKGLQSVGNAVKDNRIIPAISGVYISAVGKEIEIRGTDLEMTIVAGLAADVAEEGIVVVKATALQDYVKEIDDDFIEIKQVGNEITIATSKSSSSFALLDSDEYPDTMNFESEVSCTIDSDSFAEGVDKTIIGAASTPDNLAVHSVRLEIAEKSMRLVTSDTYRMFFFEQELFSPCAGEIKASLPLRTASSVVKIIRALEVPKIEVASSKHLVCITIGNVRVLSKIIDLPYPDYAKIMSSLDFDKAVLCDLEETTSMLRRVLIFARENSDVKNGAILQFEGNSLEVEATSDQAHVKEKVVVVKKGDDLKISLNVKFILDFLNQISGNICMKLKDADSAVLLSEEDKDNFVCLTMPLSLR